MEGEARCISGYVSEIVVVVAAVVVVVVVVVVVDLCSLISTTIITTIAPPLHFSKCFGCIMLSNDDHNQTKQVWSQY